ncbi:MAG TPA: TIGR02757 family protein [Holophaga sp.]|nr:TIGR02757 family protein [Holophaga sp.]
MKRSGSALKARLDELHDRYRSEAALALDPIVVPLAFADPRDRELAAFVAAHLAYGRVAPMLQAIRGALAPLGARPAQALRALGAEAAPVLARDLGAWVWRFHTAEDMAHWMAAWADLDRETGGRGLEPLLVPEGDQDADARLSALVRRLRRELPDTPGLRFNLPDPREGAACKRWRMFLRWMVRDGWPDLGLWRNYPPASLVIPLDTHVARISRFIGLARRRTPDGRLAQEITQALRALDPGDPLRYDFALAHLGILGDCPGVRTLPACRKCPLVNLCRAGL